MKTECNPQSHSFSGMSLLASSTFVVELILMREPMISPLKRGVLCWAFDTEIKNPFSSGFFYNEDMPIENSFEWV